MREGQFLVVCEDVKIGEENVAAHYEDPCLLKRLRYTKLVWLQMTNLKLGEVLVHDSFSEEEASAPMLLVSVGRENKRRLLWRVSVGGVRSNCKLLSL